MLISVIIPTLNSSGKLQQCLSSLNSQTLRTGDQMQIIVVFDANAKKPESLGADDATVLYCTQPGVSAARNMGMRVAHGELIYFLDDDCQLASNNQIAGITDYLVRHPEIDMVGAGYSSVASGDVWQTGYNQMVNLWMAAGKQPQRLPGGNIIFRRRLLSLGLRFNDQYTWGGEETEWLDRLQSSGVAVRLAREFGVQHDCCNSFWKTLIRGFLHGRSAAKTENQSWRMHFSLLLQGLRLLQFRPSFALLIFASCHWPSYFFGRLFQNLVNLLSKGASSAYAHSFAAVRKN